MARDVSMGVGFVVKDSAFKEGMARVRKEASSTAEGVEKAFGGTGKAFEDALQSVEFQAVAEEASEASLKISRSFEKTGKDLKAVFNQATPFDDLEVAAHDAARVTEQGLKKAFESVSAEAAELRSDIEKTFDGDAPDRLLRSLAQLEAAFAETGTDGKKSLERIEKALEDVKTEAGRAKHELNEFRGLELAAMAEQIGRVADRLSAFAGQFDAAGAEARNLERQMKAAFADPKEAAAMTATITELQKDFGHLGFSVDDFSQAVKRASALGIGDLDKNMQRFANVAAATGKQIDDVADDFGEFLADINKGKFDPEAIESISKNFGIAAKELEPFGAEVDKNGKLLAGTSEQAQKAQKAIIDYVDSAKRFQNVSGRSADNISQLEGELDELKKGIGEGSNVMKEFVAGGLLPIVKTVNELSPGLKTAAGLAIEGAAGLGQFAARGVEMASIAALGANQLRALGVTSLATAKTMAAAAASTAAFTLGTAAAVAGVALIVVEFGRMVNAVLDAKKAHEQFRETQKRALEDSDISKYVDKNIGAIKAEVSAIEDAGKRRAELSAAILAKEAAIQDAREKGKWDLSKALVAELAEIRAMRSEYDAQAAAVVQAEQEKKQAIEDRYAAAESAYRKYQATVSRGDYDSKRDQLRDLGGIIGGLTGEAAKEALSDRKKLNAEILAEEISTLKEIAKEQALSGSEVQSTLVALLSQYQSHGEARKQIEKDVGDFIQGIDEARAARVRQFNAEELALKKSALEIESRKSALADEEIAGLNGRLDKGEDVLKQLESELEARAETGKRLLEQEAILDRLAIKQKANAEAANEPDKGNRIKIYEQAAERERQLNEKLALDKAAIERQLSKDQEAAQKKKTDNELKAAERAKQIEREKADLALQALEQQRQAQAQGYEERRQQLLEEQALGKNNREELGKLDEEIAKAQKVYIDERFKLELEAIAKRKAVDKIGKSQSEQELIDARAKLDIEKAVLQCRVETNAIVDQSLQLKKEELAEELKILEAIKKQNSEREQERKKQMGFKSTIQGGAQSVEDAFSNNASGWGVSRHEAGGATDDKGRTQAEIERDVARKRASLERKESATPSAPPEVRPVNVPSGDRSQQPQKSAAEHYAQPPSEPLRLDPSVVGIWQQMLTAIQQTAQNTRSTPKPPESIAQNWERATGFTLG